MALFKIEKGLAADLSVKRPNTVEGYCYFTTDDGKFYIDTTTSNGTSNRVCLNANKADKLAKAVTIALDGNITGSTSFDGSKNVTINVDTSTIDNAITALQARKAFTNIIVGNTTIAADSKSDSLTFVAGSNITLTPDVANDKVTIAATDTGATTVTVTGNGNAITTASYNASTRTITLDKGATYNNYSLPQAGSSLGGIKTGGVATISGGQITAISKATSATTANRVSNSLTVGSKTYNGSAAVEIIASDLGLSNAMHFRGVVSPLPANTSGYVNGDVILVGNKEYVCSNSNWIELGDESSFALKDHNHNGTYIKNTGDTMSGNLHIENSNPYVKFIDTASNNQVYYVQGYQGNFAFGPTYASAVQVTSTGSMSLPDSATLTPRTTNTGSVGTNDAKWNAMYATTFNGNATSATKVNTDLIIKLNGGTTEGTNLFTFNGSTAKTVNITPSAIGAAASSHGTHVSYGTSATAIGAKAGAGSASTVSRSDHTHSLSKSAVTTALGYTPPTTNTTYSTVTSSAAGLAPAYGTAAAGTIDSSTTDWVLTYNNGSLGWYKLPANAFKNDNTVYTHPAGSAASKTSKLYKFSTDATSHIKAVTAVTKADITALGIPAQDTTYTFTNKNVTLAWGTTSTIATVGGTDITVKMPANPNTNTHYKAYLYATGSNGTANAATANGNTYLRLIENSEARSSIKVAGAGLTTVKSDGSGNITISTSLNGINAGDSNTPVYLNSGTFTECTSLDLNTTGSAAKLAGETKLTSSTIDEFLEGNILKWAPSDGSAVGGNDGVVMSLGWSGTYGAQIWLDDGPGEGEMKIRNRKASGWNEWRQVLTEYNYNDYSPTLTGTGASGTWGISISGNAASATQLATARKINSVSFNGTKDITFAGSYTTATAPSSIPTGISYIELPGIATSTGDPVYGTCLTVSSTSTTRAFQLGVNNSPNVYIRAMHTTNTSTTVPGYTEWYQVWRKGNSVTGAVWNDYAECRESDCEEFGYVLMETGNDSLTKTTERLSHFAGVSSDTWGFSQGETARARTPIAVAGRVLVYPYQDRNNYKPGDCVCAAPNGTVDIMTREEIINWPDRIVGIVSCVPDYEEWGGGENADRKPVKVDNRIWIKIK